jgi:predicted AlkP superfamily pyrophosphatase or phosphodiesterase
MAQEYRPLVLISLDGFRPDYLDRQVTPTLNQLLQEGVTSKGMIPVFPSKTFPNHYSIVTGLYTESTGLVANNMYDPELKAFYSLANRAAVQNPKWYGGEPVWVTAERQGVRTASLFWPGSEAAIKGIQPTRWKVYDHVMPYKNRIDTVISWMAKNDVQRPAFVNLYFDAVDTNGHLYGTQSDSLLQAVIRVDNILAYFIDELERIGIWPNFNLIITSDHGMHDTSSDQVILLDKLVNMEWIQVIEDNPVAMIQPKPGYKDQVFTALSAPKNPPYQVYKKEDVPERFRVKNNSRVPEIILIAEPGFSVTTTERLQKFGVSKGTHGYDNTHPSMQALFVAHGPAFQQGLVIDSFENVHLYALLCKLLNIEPAPNDGQLNVLQPILKTQ